MKNLKHLILLLLLSWVAFSCKSVPGNSPVRIGMPKSDVYKVCHVIAEEGWVIGPAEMAECLRIRSDRNIEYLLAFDPTEHIQLIFTTDAAFKLPNGVGVNSTFAELKKHYKDYKFYYVLGHARYLAVNDGTAFGFVRIIDGDNRKIEDEEKVKWIEL